MSHPIEKAWETFRKVYPADISNAQLRDLKDTFYAGSLVMLNMVMSSLPKPQTTPTEQKLQFTNWFSSMRQWRMDIVTHHTLAAIERRKTVTPHKQDN